MNDPPPSDENLILALGHGDETALRMLVDRHTASVYRFAVRYTGDESLAQDICQEVFLKIYRNAGRYKSGMPFRNWLFTIAQNTSIDLARPYTYRKIHSLDPADETEAHSGITEPLSGKAPTPEEEYAAREKALSLESALAKLSEKQRTAIILKYYEEMSTKEVAGIMETTVSSVESLLVRAKLNLIKLLQL